MKRRQEGGQQKRRARRCAHRFYLFFFVSDATWQERGEGSTLPTSVLRDKGRAESLPHLFRGADTLPVGFAGNGKGITPSPRVFDANGKAGPLPHFFRRNKGRVHPLRWFQGLCRGDEPLHSRFRCQRGWTPPSPFLTRQGKSPEKTGGRTT